jgi:hypothetical protein
MRRRDIPAALLASAAGGSAVSSPAMGQTDATYIARTAAEVRAGVSPSPKGLLYHEGDIR